MEETVKEVKDIKTVKDAKWYAIRVMSGKEKKAIESLNFEFDIENVDKYVAQVLCPMETEYKMRNGKKTKRDKIVFSGYIFMEAKLTGELPRIVKNTKWVTDFTRNSNGSPAELRQEDINRIIGNIEKAETGEIPFVIGESISIIDGPFNTFKGDVITVDEKSQTLKVNVLIFGRATPLDLSYVQVERVED